MRREVSSEVGSPLTQPGTFPFPCDTVSVGSAFQPARRHDYWYPGTQRPLDPVGHLGREIPARKGFDQGQTLGAGVQSAVDRSAIDSYAGGDQGNVFL